MYLSKELSKINGNEDNLDMVLDKIEKEKQVLDNKLHIFTIMKFVKNIKEIAPMLIEEGIITLRVSTRATDKGVDGRSETLELSPRRSDVETQINVRDEKQKFLPWFLTLLKVTEDLLLNPALTESFTQKRVYNPQDINLKGDIEKQFYDILLNKELKTALDYNVLHLKLESKNTQTERIKVKPAKI